MAGDRRGAMGRLFDLCLGALVAALMLYVAVQLVQSVLWWLIGLGGLALLIGLAVALLRYRSERW